MICLDLRMSEQNEPNWHVARTKGNPNKGRQVLPCHFPDFGKEGFKVFAN